MYLPGGIHEEVANYQGLLCTGTVEVTDSPCRRHGTDGDLVFALGLHPVPYQVIIDNQIALGNGAETDLGLRPAIGRYEEIAAVRHLNEIP